MHVLIAALALISPAVVGLAEAELSAVLRGGVSSRSETFTTPAGKAAGRVVGAIVVDRPVADVWAVIAKYEDKPEYQPRLQAVDVLERQPGRLRVRMVIDASVMTVRYTGWFVLDPDQRTIRWTIDRSATDNNITDVVGDYRLFEIAPGRTLVVYRTYVDSGRSVPRFIQDYSTRKSLPKLLESVKKRVESGGTYRK